MHIKSFIKSAFPNATGIYKLMQQKRYIQRITDLPASLAESDYPSYLQHFYEGKAKHQLNLDKPKRFTEKVQWRKLYDKDEIYSLLSDKYRVREWVRMKIGEDYLIPILGCWNHFDEIDFDSLPDQFVLKTNNSCHTNFIVKNKKQFLRGRWAARRTMEYWMNSPQCYYGLELHYKRIKPLIVAEKYLQPAKGKYCLTDYKFHCFSGNPLMCEVIDDRTTNEVVDYYDMQWNHLPLTNPPFSLSSNPKPIPDNYEEMIRVVKQLSRGFQYVRVDLYNTDRVYFGEMTFTPANGTDKYDPDEWDYHMGELWDINAIQVDHSTVMNNVNK